MKKYFVLNFLLLFVIANITASSFTLESTGIPVSPKKVLPYKSIAFDLGSSTTEGVDTTHLFKEDLSIDEKTYNFPDLDEQLMSSINADLSAFTVVDKMEDITNIPENDEEEAAKSTIEAAKLGGTKVESFDDLLNMTLPVYRIQQIGNLEAIIVINSLRLTAGDPNDPNNNAGGRVGVYVGIKIPQKSYDQEGRKRNVTLIFGSENIAFSKEGGISVGDVRLLNDAAFELGGSQRKSIVVLNKGNVDATEGTYIRFGCKGVEEFSIDGGIYFSREWMLPVDGGVNGRVYGAFAVVVQDWNNLLVTASISHFKLTKFQDMSFALSNANLDLSDFKNPPNMIFPENYDEPEGTLWRGVYVEHILVTLPPPFKKKCPNGQTCQMTIEAKKLIIDKEGVTGLFSVSSSIPLADGALMDGKWNWSLDQVDIGITKSDFDLFSFSGGIVIPVAEKNTPFGYSATVDFQGPEAIYSFDVTTESQVNFPVFKAFHVTIEENSELNVVLQGGEFKASALLHGAMSIGKGDPKEDVQVPRITFSDLALSTENPKLSGGSVFIESGGSKLNNFPVQISGIGIGFAANSVHLDFTLGLNLMDKKHGGLTANGTFQIFGKLIEDEIGADKWVFDRLNMSGFQVKIDLPAFKGCGELSVFDQGPDSQYGKGFSAKLDASILGKNPQTPGNYNCAVVPGALSLKMAAIFGNKDGMRYFMVDAYVGSDKVDVPLPPTPLAFTGFGGGVQYRMKLAGYQDPQTSTTPPPQLGVDATGLIYEPDENTLFGIKFATGITTIGFKAAGGSPITGTLNCIIRFGEGLSLQNITFWGTAELLPKVPADGITALPKVLKKIESLNLSDEDMHKEDMAKVEAASDKIMAKLGLSFDFDDGFSFHGYAEVKLRAANGALNGFGQLDLLIDPNEEKWHFWLGGYENEEVEIAPFLDPEGDKFPLFPVQVTLEYAGLKVFASAYFLTGNDIPGPPGVHPIAAEIFNIQENENVENRKILNCGTVSPPSSPANGTGVAFGASIGVELDSKIKAFGITLVKIKVRGNAGFDIALLQYGPETVCQNGQADHGVNGFRATGSIWAYVSVSGKVLGFKIPSIGVGVFFQADLPNPGYVQGKVVLEFKKRWEFGFDRGDKCGHPCSVLN